MNNNNEQGSAGTPQERAAVPKGFVLVPLHMTAEMRRVTDEEGWQWEDLLAAAESITEDQYDEISAPVAQEGEQQSYAEADGCPTERAVLQRFWREHQAAQPTPSKEGEQSARPMNGIPATMRHDEGAIAQCAYCRRYSLDPATLSDRQPACEYGKKNGWSGSFKRPGPDAKWSGKARTTQPTPSDSASVDTLEFRKLLNAAFAHRGVEGSKETVGNLIAHIESLIAARVADVRKDAERYRYMRNNATFQSRNGPGLYWYLPRWNRGLPEGERLDRAIDAAIDAEMSTHSPATSSKEGGAA